MTMGEALRAPRPRFERRRLALRAGGRQSGFLLILALLVLWEISARTDLVDSPNWPPFTQVLVALVQGLQSGELPGYLGSTLARTAIGLGIGSLLGFAFAAAMASSRLVFRTLEPTIELLRPLPAPAIVPPLILFLGLEDRMKITLVAFTVFFPMFINTMRGLTSLEPTYRGVAATFGVRGLRMFRTVLLPATLPYVFAGLRVGLGLAFIVAVVGEMIAGSSGIGYHLMSMQYGGRAPEMYAALLLLGISGYLLSRTLVLVEHRVIHWHGQVAE